MSVSKASSPLCQPPHNDRNMKLSVRTWQAVPMNTQLSELLRLLTNLIRIGTISEVDTENGLCRVQTGRLETTPLKWLTMRAGSARTWWAPSIGEQVLILSMAGELTTAFVLPAIFLTPIPPPRTRRAPWLRSSPTVPDSVMTPRPAP